MRLSPDTVWYLFVVLLNGGMKMSIYLGIILEDTIIMVLDLGIMSHVVDPDIRVFSHTHMVGSGVTDYGTIGVMPMNRIPSSSDVTDYGFRSRFSHSEESASPGYYRVFLEDPQVDIELTSTERVGVHKYKYAPNSKKVVLFDIRYKPV